MLRQILGMGRCCFSETSLKNLAVVICRGPEFLLFPDRNATRTGASQSPSLHRARKHRAGRFQRSGALRRLVSVLQRRQSNLMHSLALGEQIWGDDERW